MGSIEKDAVKIYSSLVSINGDSNKALIKDMEDFIHNGSLSEIWRLLSFVIRGLSHSQSTQQQTIVENFLSGVSGFSLEYLLCDVLSLEYSVFRPGDC